MAKIMKRSKTKEGNVEVEVDMTEALAKVDAELAEYKKTRMTELWQRMTSDDDFDMNKAKADLMLELAAKRTERLEEERDKALKEIANQVDEAENAKEQAELNSDDEPLIQRSKRRKRAAEIRDKGKGIAIAADDEYTPEAENELPCDSDGEASQKSTKEIWGIDEYFHAFLGCTFAGTIYPDEETTKTLGIHGDYVHLMTECGLHTYMGRLENTYPDAAAEFLASVRFHEAKGAACSSFMGGGHLDFTIFGEPHMITLRDLTTLFGFPDGNPKATKISKEERQRIWKYLSGSNSFASASKGGMRIRSPVVSYVRRAIAETFYSRADTGIAAACDLNCLIPGIARELKGNLVGGKKLVGDPADGSLAFAMAKHLESYRTTVKTAKGKITPITIGGPITAIMRRVQVKGID